MKAQSGITGVTIIIVLSDLWLYLWNKKGNRGGFFTTEAGIWVIPNGRVSPIRSDDYVWGGWIYTFFFSYKPHRGNFRRLFRQKGWKDNNLMMNYSNWSSFSILGKSFWSPVEWRANRWVPTARTLVWWVKVKMIFILDEKITRHIW